MRDFSKVSPSVWKSRKFRNLQVIEARITYLYLLTCPHGNSAGVFDLDPLYACADIGSIITQEAYAKAIDSLCEVGLIEYDKTEGTILIVNWDEFNVPTNPKHAIGILSQIEQASSKRLKAAAFHAFLRRFGEKGFNSDRDLQKTVAVFLKAYPKAITTEIETEIETKTEKETERRGRGEERETETRENSRAALRTVAAKGRDGLTPSLPPEGTPRVAVLDGSEEMAAWEQFNGKKSPRTDVTDPETGHKRRGWYFPTQWPPGHAAEGLASGGVVAKGTFGLLGEQTSVFPEIPPFLNRRKQGAAA